MAEPLIRLENIEMIFGDKKILNSINMYVKDREFLTLLGPSGCGKTTTLRIIGGFETPSGGAVYFEGKDIISLPPHKRAVNTVFQKYALFPHMDVFDNIAFGLRLQKISAREIQSQIADMLRLVNLQGYENRRVTSLSGGEQQRVAIARALVCRPRVLLLDEPLGALDLKLRKEMQTELKKIQTTLGITFIYVTHDQEEALSMSDTIAVMNRGSIQQIGSPIDIYNEPSNAFVADFIGESNIVDGVMPEDETAEFAGRRFKCVDRGFAKNQPVDIVIRPEDLKIVPENEAQLMGEVISVVFKGVHYEMQIEAAGVNWLVQSTIKESVGDRVGLFVAPFDIHVMHKMPASYEGEEPPEADG